MSNLWHYTTLKGIEGIISSQCLWATDYRYLNDSLELLYSKDILYKKALPRIKAIIGNESVSNKDTMHIVNMHGGIDKISEVETLDTLKILYDGFLKSPNLNTLPCVLSFCKASLDNSILQKDGLLSQWRGYGKDGGFAIIFNMQAILDELNTDGNVFHFGLSVSGDVVYTSYDLINDDMNEKLETVVKHIENFYLHRLDNRKNGRPSNGEFMTFIECMAMIKHIGFSEEMEFRLFVVPIFEGDKNIEGFKEDKKKSFKKILFRETQRGLAPYISLFGRGKILPIEGVCVGPHKDKESRAESIKTYLRTLGYGHIKVFCSSIPFIG